MDGPRPAGSVPDAGQPGQVEGLQVTEDRVGYRLERHGDHHPAAGDAAQFGQGRSTRSRRKVLQDVDRQHGVHRLVGERQGQQVRGQETGGRPLRPADAARQRGRGRDKIGADEPQPGATLGGQQRQEPEAAPDVQDRRAPDEGQDVRVDPGEGVQSAGSAGIGTAQAPDGVAVKGGPGAHRIGIGGQDRFDEDLLERRSVGHEPERGELSGNMIREFVAEPVGKTRPRAPLLD